MVGERQRLLDVLLHQQDRRAGRRLRGEQDGVDLLPPDWARGPRSARRSEAAMATSSALARDGEHAPLAAGERAGTVARACP